LTRDMFCGRLRVIYSSWQYVFPMNKSRECRSQEFLFGGIVPTAILIDGGFFQKRYNSVYPHKRFDPRAMSKDLFTLALGHIDKEAGERLYRIFYYDCPPLNKKAHHPLTKKCIDYSKTSRSEFQLAFFEELKKLRKVALRLGEVRSHGGWQVNSTKLQFRSWWLVMFTMTWFKKGLT